MCINNFLTQVYRVCSHLASVQVYSLTVSYSIKNRCNIKLLAGRLRRRYFEVIKETTRAIFQLKHINQSSIFFFEMPEIIYKTDLDNVDWAEMKATLCKDAFDNGHSQEQLKTSFENSYSGCIADADHRSVGTARVLSDGVCNAYLVDVWTLSAYRRQGIATAMMQNLLSRLKGQHVYLFTDDVPVYAKLGFAEQPIGMGQVIGTWLVNEE